MKRDYPQNGWISEGIRRRPQPLYSHEQWLGHLAELGSKCYWCGVPLTEASATKDHLQPLSRFGTDCLANIVPSCFACNCKKGKKNEEEFVAWKAGRRIVKSTGDSSSKADMHSDLLRANFVGAVHDYMENLTQDKIIQLRRESEGGSWAWKHPPRAVSFDENEAQAERMKFAQKKKA